MYARWEAAATDYASAVCDASKVEAWMAWRPHERRPEHPDDDSCRRALAVLSLEVRGLRATLDGLSAVLDRLLGKGTARLLRSGDVHLESAVAMGPCGNRGKSSGRDRSAEAVE